MLDGIPLPASLSRPRKPRDARALAAFALRNYVPSGVFGNESLTKIIFPLPSSQRVAIVSHLKIHSEELVCCFTNYESLRGQYAVCSARPNNPHFFLTFNSKNQVMAMPKTRETRMSEGSLRNDLSHGNAIVERERDKEALAQSRRREVRGVEK